MKYVDQINGSTKVYGLIGHPIKHTLSPIIHNTLANMLGNNMIYVPFEVPSGGLKEALVGAYQLNIQGLNVTVPYKQEVIPFLLKLEGYADQIGAVNTLKRSKDGYIGYNTDAEGLLQSLLQNDINIRGQNIMIIGAGGAARAAAMVTASQNPKQILIVNRTQEKAQELAQAVSRYYNVPVKSGSLDFIVQDFPVDVCIQTTSVGLYPREDQSPVTDETFFTQVQAAVDLIYNPSETLFLKMAKAAGCKTVNGFGMLFYQAIKAYEIWNEIIVPQNYVDLLFQSLKKELNL
ncbi:shikimate dehydrogenase [Defluviitalea raffinosedens]|uniref:Shikimate dehydrogenase (NADP(+)) n=1 Tax=Defluviitalea raffinosedens TaxID=1450156 RepID=A0A7C8LLD9_9FIRM|nr:shikimate dehydrogenase [Defluviitalea raffinosedens]KAE9637244.1 shikimate dehydrogenase [Defluviitalea raffinosedens]MBM7685545.1 shikimate dehydrogenase [Defluviitalea raffinosedens]